VNYYISLRILFIIRYQVLGLEVAALAGESLDLARGMPRLADELAVFRVDLVVLLGLFGCGSVQLSAHSLELSSHLLQLVSNRHSLLRELLVLVALFYKFLFALLVFAVKGLNIAQVHADLIVLLLADLF
jgi:hypothetical protein